MAEFEIIEVAPRHAAIVRGRLPVGELPAFFGVAFTSVMKVLAEQGMAPIGPPFGYYPCPPDDRVDVEAGFPTAEPVEPSGDVVPLVLPHGRAVRTVHVGPYDTMHETYAALTAWMAEHGERPCDQMWETYLSDPTAEPDPSTWRTEIVWPLHPRS